MATTKTKQETKAGAGEVYASLQMFDYRSPDPAVNHRWKFIGTPFDDLDDAMWADYAPSGGTPLYDAVRFAVEKLDEQVKAKPAATHFAIVIDESGSMASNTESVKAGVSEFVGGLKGQKPADDEGRVMLVIVTDGQENSSKQTTAQQIQEIVSEREGIGWEFLYLGANHDAWQGAGSLGISAQKGNAANFTSSVRGTRSALRRAGGQAVNYLGDQGQFASYKANTMDVVAEDDGGDMEPNIPEPPKPSGLTARSTLASTGESYGDVHSAIKRARGESEDDES